MASNGIEVKEGLLFFIHLIFEILSKNLGPALAGAEQKCAESILGFLSSQLVGTKSADKAFYSLTFKLSQSVTEVNKNRLLWCHFKKIPFFI